MRLRVPILVLLFGLAAVASGCATAEQWSEWRRHSSHFASGDHLRFSLRNQRANGTARVEREDIQKAATQSWWGDPVVVRPDQLFAG